MRNYLHVASFSSPMFIIVSPFTAFQYLPVLLENVFERYLYFKETINIVSEKLQIIFCCGENLFFCIGGGTHIPLRSYSGMSLLRKESMALPRGIFSKKNSKK